MQTGCRFRCDAGWFFERVARACKRRHTARKNRGIVVVRAPDDCLRSDFKPALETASVRMVESGFDGDEVRRAVIQHLEGLRRAGVTHWKHIEPVVPVSANAATASRPASSAKPSLFPARSATSALGGASQIQSLLVPQSPSSSESASSQLAKKKSVSPEPSLIPRAPFQPLNLPLDQRVAALNALAECVKNCKRCPELAETRTQTVFGVGNPAARIMFVGEAPGADEDKQGEPFVGRAGQLLNDIIKACRLQREEIYICNVLRCRPPGNRQPAPEEAANCREYLDGQIAHVNPEYIVCWGASAAQNLLSAIEPIGKLRGRFFTYGRAKVLCTYHPSYLLRNPAAKKDVWEDMKVLFLDMGIDLSAKA
jgi:uracil-DNA glycosylase family 4